jgi:outer membrane protein assembly factor BamE (lipoprotein component of BamABCDE complex)
MNTQCCLALALLTAIGGCSSYRMHPVPPELERDYLPFLERGETRRAEIVAILGRPSYEHESDRVMAYRMSRDGFGELAVVDRQGRYGWRNAQYNLVLTFDENLVLQDHVLLQLKEKGKW